MYIVFVVSRKFTYLCAFLTAHFHFWAAHLVARFALCLSLRCTFVQNRERVEAVREEEEEKGNREMFGYRRYQCECSSSNLLSASRGRKLYGINTAFRDLRVDNIAHDCCCPVQISRDSELYPLTSTMTVTPPRDFWSRLIASPPLRDKA